uniref:Zinc finger PHD-type domain-containing protein n=1 Tax=Globisporangium ultimum (strain ATCC 200006 / CBS 805.95 / DAOM BR144) TaxID=431595 RepID=K3WYF6_GLOUD
MELPPQSNYRLGGANSSHANTPILHTAMPNAEGGDDVGMKNLSVHVGIGDENAAMMHPREPVAKIPDSEELQCMTCGKHGDAPEMMKCCSCANAFHARCANLPSVPEEGAFFCRWSCFSSFHKRRALGQRELNGDFPRLAEQIESVLRNIPRLHRGSTDREIHSGAERKRALGHANGYNRRSSRAENVDVNQIDRDADVGFMVPRTCSEKTSAVDQFGRHALAEVRLAHRLESLIALAAIRGTRLL